MYVVDVEGYAHRVPFVESEEEVFLKTIIPSREATRDYDRRINIRISSRDLEALQTKALVEGIPYQTLIASVLHKYAAGRLREDNA